MNDKLKKLDTMPQKSDLGVRVATAVVALGLAFGVVFTWGEFGFGVLVALVILLSSWELLTLLKFDFAQKGFFLVSSAVILWERLQGSTDVFGYFILFNCLYLAFETIRVKTSPSSLKESLLKVQPFTFAMVYLVLSPAYLIHIVTQISGGMILGLGYLIVIWVTDTGAYLVGRQFGRTKLHEKLSPKKSWEGTIGGVIFGTWLGGYFWTLNYPLDHKALWFVLAFCVSVCSQIGDLFESWLKRVAEQKDSGILLPGHGGFLDRFDAVLFAVPVLWYGVKILGLGR